jgi:hypothetical protein
MIRHTHIHQTYFNRTMYCSRLMSPNISAIPSTNPLLERFQLYRRVTAFLSSVPLSLVKEGLGFLRLLKQVKHEFLLMRVTCPFTCRNGIGTRSDWRGCLAWISKSGRDGRVRGDLRCTSRNKHPGRACIILMRL